MDFVTHFPQDPHTDFSRARYSHRKFVKTEMVRRCDANAASKHGHPAWVFFKCVKTALDLYTCQSAECCARSCSISPEDKHSEGNSEKVRTFLTCHHEGEVKAFLHRLPVDLVGQCRKTYIIFFLKTKQQSRLRKERQRVQQQYVGLLHI